MFHSYYSNAIKHAVSLCHIIVTATFKHLFIYMNKFVFLTSKFFLLPMFMNMIFHTET